MPIVDARAISYDNMQRFAAGQPVQLQTQNGGDIQPHDAVWVISITDHDLPKIFADSDRVLTLVFSDIEPMDPKFVPPDDSHYMKEAQAVQVLDFIEKAQQSPDKIMLLVNCRHGMCRSGAVVSFVGNVCGLGYWNTQRRNPQIVPNHWNQLLLFKEHFKRELKDV